MNWIKGYEGLYYATEQGQIIRKGKMRDSLVKGYKGGKIWVAKLTKNGKAKEHNYGRLIFETFKGPIPPGYVIYRRNNLIDDNRLLNIRLTTKSERGKSTGPRSKSKPVELLDDCGNVVDSWSSARQAAEDLYCSRQTVTDICNLKVKKKLVNVRWEKAM